MRISEVRTPVISVESSAAALRRAYGAEFGRARPRKPDSPTRAPFAGPLSRVSNRESVMESQLVPAHIRSAGDELGPHDRDYIRRKLGMRLGKFSHFIERVSVRTEDVNGPRGGVDRVCRIKVVLRGLPSVVYEHRDASLNAAIDEALAGVARVVSRAVARRRMKPRRRVGISGSQERPVLEDGDTPHQPGDVGAADSEVELPATEAR